MSGMLKMQTICSASYFDTISYAYNVDICEGIGPECVTQFNHSLHFPCAKQ